MADGRWRMADGGWQMADLAVGTIRVYLPHTNEFVPENCGIISGSDYKPVVY